MKWLSILLMGMLLLSGCTGNDYALYSKVKEREVTSNEEVEKAKYAALEAIASQGDTTATVAAIIAMQVQGSGNSGSQVRMAAPVSNSDRALQWAAIITPALIPALSNAYSVNQQSGVSKANIKYGTEATIATNEAFVKMSDNIQAPTYNYDSTHEPTVVNQPEPVIVNQPTPVIVNPTVVNQPAPVIVQPEVVAPVIVNSSTGVGTGG